MLHIVLLLYSTLAAAQADQPTKPPHILLVVAHPDDEYYFAGAVYRLAKEKNAVVDELVITNGEAGFRYSELSEPIYHLKLHDEKIGRAELPAIREKEAIAGGKIIGIHEHFFLRQKDFGYTQDPEVAFQKWDLPFILKSIAERIQQSHDEFVWVLAPLASTHGHHQAATILALQAVQKLPVSEQPTIIAGSTDKAGDLSLDPDHETERKESRNFSQLKKYPITKIVENSEIFRFNRNQTFGFKEKLSYQIPVNWMIAEHKSQGEFQTFMNRDDEELFRVFALSGADGIKKTKSLFEWMKP